MKYTYTAPCPICGAPVFALEAPRVPQTEDERQAVRARIRKKPSGERLLRITLDEAIAQATPDVLAAIMGVEEVIAPVARYTCGCRHALPAPVPDVDVDVVESVTDADLRSLARERPSTREAPSEERVD